MKPVHTPVTSVLKVLAHLVWTVIIEEALLIVLVMMDILIIILLVKFANIPVLSVLGVLQIVQNVQLLLIGFLLPIVLAFQIILIT